MNPTRFVPVTDPRPGQKLYANWSLNRRSPWHRTSAHGDDRDKTTLCGRTFKNHAEWSTSYRPDASPLSDDPRFCERCEKAAGCSDCGHTTPHEDEVCYCEIPGCDCDRTSVGIGG